jgi:hypothetical protein
LCSFIHQDAWLPMHPLDLYKRLVFHGMTRHCVVADGPTHTTLCHRVMSAAQAVTAQSRHAPAWPLHINREGLVLCCCCCCWPWYQKNRCRCRCCSRHPRQGSERHSYSHPQTTLKAALTSWPHGCSRESIQRLLLLLPRA